MSTFTQDVLGLDIRVQDPVNVKMMQRLSYFSAHLANNADIYSTEALGANGFEKRLVT